MWKKLILMMILLIPVASAATIHGSVYDYSLNIVKDAKVAIDTTPQQVIVAKEGLYSFNAPIGSYKITALKNDIGIKENITVKDEGNYNLDLILVDSLDEDTGLLQDHDINVDASETEPTSYIKFSLIVLAQIIFLAFVAYLTRRYIKARKSDEEEIKPSDDKNIEGNLEKLVNIIKDEGGRTTQKDIRKKLGLSEAKVSLMVAELESKGVVKKIKKGRGNIIILS